MIDFTSVAHHGGLGKASRASGRSKATLSRRIADLEQQLGVRLIERSARVWAPRETGATVPNKEPEPVDEAAVADIN